MAATSKNDDINIKNSKGQVPLHLAAADNKFKEIQQLLARGADVNAVDDKGKIPLHYAAAHNLSDTYFRTIELLLKSGAAVNAVDNLGRTALHYLVDKLNVKTVKLLLDSGANVNIKDKGGDSALNYAILFTSNSTEVAKLLIDYGSDVNSVNKYKQTPLIKTCSHFHCRIETFELLVKNGADLHAVDSQGKNAMMLMSDNRSVELNLPFLLKRVDVSTADVMGRNALNSYLNPRNSLGTRRTIVKHLAKLQACNITLHPSILGTLSCQPGLEKFFKMCTLELEKAKSIKLENCWVTFFNFLVDGKKKVKKYAGNKDVIQGFQSSDYLMKFPIYGADMQKNVDKGIKTRKFFDKSINVLSDRWPILNPTHLIITDTLDCLTSKDYAKFISHI